MSILLLAFRIVSQVLVVVASFLPSLAVRFRLTPRSMLLITGCVTGLNAEMEAPGADVSGYPLWIVDIVCMIEGR